MRPVLLAALCAAVFTATAASAAEGDSARPFTVSGGATLVSDYRFRGASLSGGDPAAQATLNVEHESGLYGGAWGSSLEDSETWGEVELDLYAGWAGEIGGGFSLDASAVYYHYPDGSGDSDYWEGIAKLSRTLGPVEATLGAGYSPDQAVLEGDNLYLFGDLAAGIPGTPLTARAHLGRSSGSLAYDGDYLDWSIGADAELGPVTLGLAYVDTDLAPEHEVDAAIVFSVGIGF